MFDVVAMGELLVDFTPMGINEQGNSILEVNPGGAPCNVLAMLSKLGQKTAFIGKVGADHFGRMLIDTIKNEGIDASGVLFDPSALTTLAFVHLDNRGERSFSFYRSPGADCMLYEDELNIELLKKTRIFHFGTLSMTDEPAKSATKKAIQIAKDDGAIISFDPNLRLPLWKNASEAKQAMIYGMKHTDIIKLSEEELDFILDTKDIISGAKILAAQYDIKLVLVTMGSKGSMYCFNNTTGSTPTYHKLGVIDTTGAGDAFCGAMLYRFLKVGFEGLNKAYLDESLDFANAAASIVVSKRGALKACPSMEEIKHLQSLKELYQ